MAVEGVDVDLEATNRTLVLLGLAVLPRTQPTGREDGHRRTRRRGATAMVAKLAETVGGERKACHRPPCYLRRRLWVDRCSRIGSRPLHSPSLPHRCSPLLTTPRRRCRPPPLLQGQQQQHQRLVGE